MGDGTFPNAKDKYQLQLRNVNFAARPTSGLSEGGINVMQDYLAKVTTLMATSNGLAAATSDTLTVVAFESIDTSFGYGGIVVPSVE